MHDLGCKGYLTKMELRESVHTLGYNPTDRDTWKMMAKIDVDHSGTVDLMEFSNITSLIWKDHDPSDDLVLCWKVFGMNKQENRNYIKH